MIITADGKEYEVYIVDMDGTLYFKRPMQIKMAWRLLRHYTLHLNRWKELFLIYSYRKLRDKDELSDNSEFEAVIIRQLAEKYRFSENEAKEIINEWIIRRPIDTLRSCRDQHLIDYLMLQKHAGKRIFVYSDYPAKAKCDAVGIEASDIYWPDGERISVLKPSPQGLRYIIEQNNLERTRILFIGDRDEKDGVCARSMGVDCLILKQNALLRALQYKNYKKQVI